MEEHREINTDKRIEITNGTIEILGKFIYELSVPDTWHLNDIERIGDHTFVFYWRSKTEQATCSECRIASTSRSTTYFTRRIQDLPISGMTVYHMLTASRFYCDNPECDSYTFFEQFEEMVDKDARLSNRLKDFVVRYAIESSCNGASKALKKIGIHVSKDTINREVKKKGAIAVSENLKRDDVKVLSVDDINLRKGNSSTACSVFIDAETHRVLVIVKGATSEIAEKVMQQYPSIEMVSRDRGTAYAAAAKKFNKPQVADGFHLVQNIHKAIKDALSLEVANDLFVREGEGWTRMVDTSCESPETVISEEENKDGLIVIKSAKLTAEDMARRIHLAGLNNVQAQKYKKTMEILELTESGLRTPEIAKRLSMKKLNILNYRKDAPETVEKVELKIDEYYEMRNLGQWEYHQKTIAKNAKPSSESIVAPYKETVLKMFNKGKTHRDIHPVIELEGFRGSANAVYQYLIKYAHENNIPYGRNSRVIPPAERNKIVAPRPSKISIERVSRDTIYASILKTAATRREEIKQSLQEIETQSESSRDEKEQRTTKEWVNKTCYPESIAKIIFDTRPKNKNFKKKLNNNVFKRIEETFDIIPRLTAFLILFYEALVLADIKKLDLFIKQYQSDSLEPLSTFASGLKRDYAAVKNCLLYPQISNGPMEGTNNKIKMLRRRGYGRAGLELINALAVLPWYYKDIDENSRLKKSLAA